MQSRLPSLGTVAGLSAIVLWSTTFALARSVAEQVGPVTAGAAVYLLGGLLGVVRFACSPAPLARLRGLPPAYLWGCGALFVV